MNAMNKVAEARASALSLRDSAKACTLEQDALRFRLVRAAESLDAMVLLAVRGIERVEQLELALRLTVAALEGTPCREQALDDARAVLAGHGGATNAIGALLIAGRSTLDTEDFELILRALDLLDRFAQDELAKAGNRTKQAATIDVWSRLLIVRAKLQAASAWGGS